MAGRAEGRPGGQGAAGAGLATPPGRAVTGAGGLAAPAGRAAAGTAGPELRTDRAAAGAAGLATPRDRAAAGTAGLATPRDRAAAGTAGLATPRDQVAAGTAGLAAPARAARDRDRTAGGGLAGPIAGDPANLGRIRSAGRRRRSAPAATAGRGTGPRADPSAGAATAPGTAADTRPVRVWRHTRPVTTITSRSASGASRHQTRGSDR
jgi:hypothetical protein